MIQRRLVALAMIVSPCLMAGGCSLVNSFGDVVPLVDDSGAPDGSSGGDRTVPPPGDSGSDGTAPPPPDAPSGNETGTDSSPPPADAGADATEAGPPAPVGAVVVGGISSIDGGFTLTTLDPTSGHELAPSLREGMTVVGIHYDGLRDLWYIFENTGIGQLFPAPTDIVYLHVRELNTHTGAWTELAKLTVPAIVSTDTVAVLNGRLAYTAYAVTDATTPSYELVLVDTTNPSSPALINPPTALANLPTNTIGTRNPSNTGGTINLFRTDTTACEGDGSAELCSLVVTHVTVQSVGVPILSAQATLTTAVSEQGSVGVASFLGGGPDDVIAFPSAPGSPAKIQRFSSTTSLFTSGSTVSFGSGDIHLENLAISECYATAFVVGVPGDTLLYPVSLNGTTAAITAVDLGHAGQGVAFEPFTSTVIAPFRANGSFELDAYTLAGPAANATLTNRTTNTSWVAPGDLEPNFVGVRQPIPFPCPAH